jgi:hypothetical protein
VEAIAVSSLDGVLCFLHLVPPPPVEDAGVYSALIGKCVASGALQPVRVSCYQQYSVLVTAVAASNDDCRPRNGAV